MRSPEIMVVDAPGFANFIGRVVPGFGQIPPVDDRGPLAAVAVEDDGLEVVPADCLSHPQAVHYARHWAALTGRSVAEVYIPESLR